MLKKLLMLFLAIGLSLSAVLAAAVEVNTADETALESVKGIGPVHAKAIIDERTKNGPFKDADDLVNRVKGIGPKSVQNLEAAGLTINGSSAPPAGKTASTKSGKNAAATSAAPAATTANPMTAQTPAAATTAQAASETAAGKSKHKSKKDKAAAAASAPEAGSAAAATAAASDTKAKKPKKSKKDKAASAAAASGA
ncbi:helix-hairpin-helix domain-containing protein [Paraburkholderia guartelaensis]|uniref:Helix-hairpin-helix domain-containing protein n=1 Tax=Paraburkholderia guartelaensis TaxID=2546446 RepID=A0A4R5LCH4_9BURK|nr:helix-hairpin-helix domain-containing protein [Paraburkholderia guartelaensis]TDG06895.1 helix-hairpin-helix domain-containing protein [Paraburkholderia guartelaensis]